MIRSKVPTKSYLDNWDEIFKVKGLNEDAEPARRAVGTRVLDRLVGEIEPFKSDDGTIITTRKQRERHMKERGLANAGDFTEHWAKAAKERDLMNKGIHPSQKAERIQALRDAYEKSRDARR